VIKLFLDSAIESDLILTANAAGPRLRSEVVPQPDFGLSGYVRVSRGGRAMERLSGLGTVAQVEQNRAQYEGCTG
jgi:hypothetical protein